MADVGGAERTETLLPREAFMLTVGRYAVRYPNSRWLNLLASRASHGRYDSPAMIEREANGDWEPDATSLAWFSYIRAASVESWDELTPLVRLFDKAFGANDPPLVTPQVYSVWAQSKHLLGCLDSSEIDCLRETMVPEAVWAIETDRLNPFLSSQRETFSNQQVLAWLDKLSHPFAEGGTTRLTLDGDATKSPFDQLNTPTDYAVDGSQVSVVMPVYNPTTSLTTSVKSILGQTWENLEVIIVDDASTQGSELIDECASLDQRVKILRAPRNGGAYNARNIGIGAARGRFLTFQDADDYSHPQRIEHHVRRLESNRDCIASVSHAVRASDRLEVTTLGYRMIPVNLSSIMFRRETALRELGGYDRVRRAADSEFYRRVQATFGPESISKIEHTLAVIQLTHGSLSRGEMGFLRRHPAREAYVATSGAWLAAQTASRTAPHIQPGSRAPFFAPSHITGGQVHSRPFVDVALLGQVDAGGASDLGPIARALHGLGHTVGVMEYVGPSNVLTRAKGPGQQLAELLSSGDATWILPDDRVESKIAVIHDPMAPLVMPSSRILDAGAQSVLIPVHSPVSRELIAESAQEVYAQTGRWPHWLPSSEKMEALLREAVDPSHILPVGQWRIPAVPHTGAYWSRNPIVGVVSSQRTYNALADPLQLTTVPAARSIPVWCYGPGRRRVRQRQITRIRPAQMAWSHFLSRISILVSPVTDYISNHVLDAWAAGKVVIAQSDMEPILGDKAVYVGESVRNIDEVLERFVASPTEFEAVTQRALDWVRQHASEHAIQASFSTFWEDLRQS